MIRFRTAKSRGPASAEEQKRILSSQRLKAILALFTTSLVIALSGINYISTTSALDRLGATVGNDLRQKALRHPSDFLQNAEVAVVTADPAAIRDEMKRYANDPDIAYVVVADGAGAVLASHGTPPAHRERLFGGQPNRLIEMPGAFASWTAAQVGSRILYKAAFVISTARLDANQSVRGRIVALTGIACIVALGLSFAFVRFYLLPLVELTEDAFERLESTTAAAIEASRLKSEFVANMSHELRTPLNSVINFAGLLGEDLEEEGLTHFLPDISKIITAGNHLLKIVGEILDFSKIEAGRAELQPESFSIREVTREVVQVAEPLAAKNSNRLHVTDESGESFVCNDVQKFRQSLLNLVSNACKFTHDGEIAIELRQQEWRNRAAYRIDVRDTGIGIEAAQLRRLFQPFTQADGSAARKYGGTGLGLVISQRFCRMMGGDLKVESEPGKGSTFSILLPAETPTCADKKRETS
jgi:signal transduction histidine kinase